MPAGYEDQFPEGAGNDERLRDAFAQLLASGSNPQASMENLWGVQGRDQLPAPRQVQQWDTPLGTGEMAPMPQQSRDPSGLNFPQALAGPGAPNPEPPRSMPGIPGPLPPYAKQPPFPGAQDVQVRPAPMSEPPGQFGLPPSLTDMVRRGRR